MNSYLYYLVLSLIIAGTFVMYLSIQKTTKILYLFNYGKERKSWRILYSLMVFFLFGYALAILLVLFNQSEGIILLTGIVFFFGALFVLLSINIYHETLRILLLTQTEYLKSQEQLQSSVEAKEILIKEIHHRVKNNLLIVSSLLNWQVEGLQEPDILQVFTDSQKRIDSMALIHEKLYRSSDLIHIDFGDYLKTLVSQLLESFRAHNSLIKCHYCFDPVFINVETATPCGLIVNELILNALEHAFVTKHQGNLFLILKKDTHGEISLIVQDDGIGFPENFDFRTTESLGWQLICLLAEQLEAEIQVISPPGTEVVLKFYELQYDSRL